MRFHLCFVCGERRLNSQYRLEIPAQMTARDSLRSLSLVTLTLNDQPTADRNAVGPRHREAGLELYWDVESDEKGGD